MVHFHTMLRHVQQVRSWKVRHNAAVAPQFQAHERELPSTHIENLDWMRRRQRGKSADAFLVTRAISYVVSSSTELIFVSTDEAVIGCVEFAGIPRTCHNVLLVQSLHLVSCRLAPALG